MKTFLPLGSVVRIQDYDKRLMIYGRAQKKSPQSGEVYDYIACEYPLGSVDTKKGVLFNNEAITEMYYIGFQDAEELDYRTALSKYLAEKDDGNI